MSKFLYALVGMVAKIHNYIMRLNDAYEYNFTDKELHFLVIGVLGMLFIFVVYPFFKALAPERPCDGDCLDLCVYSDYCDNFCH